MSPRISAYSVIYDVVRRIPRGRVATYGQVAALAGMPRHARLVGYALHALPESSSLPWHRVVNAQGRTSLRSNGMGHDELQRLMLQREGIRFSRQGPLPLARYQWHPRSADTPLQTSPALPPARDQGRAPARPSLARRRVLDAPSRTEAKAGRGIRTPFTGRK